MCLSLQNKYSPHEKKTVVMCRYLKIHFSRTMLHSYISYLTLLLHQKCQEVTCSENCCLFVVWLNFQIRTKVLSWGGSCAFLKDSCSCLKMHSFLPTSSPSGYDVTLVPLALLALWWCNTNPVVIRTIQKRKMSRLKGKGSAALRWLGYSTRKFDLLETKYPLLYHFLCGFTYCSPLIVKTPDCALWLNSCYDLCERVNRMFSI